MRPPHDQVASLKNKLLADGVQYAFASYVDVHGISKAKCDPISKFEEMCEGSELYTVGAVEGMGLVGPQEDECNTVPDLKTCTVLPWDKRYAWFSADCWYHGQPYHADSRVLLGKVVAKAKSMGFTMNLGIEPEFYVLRRDANGKLVPLAQT